MDLFDFVLPDTDRYTIFVSDYEGDNAGHYWLSLQCRQDLKAKADTLLQIQGTITKTLDHYGAMKAYIFLVDKNDTTNIRMTRSLSSYIPCMELFGPSDALIVKVHDYYETEIVDSFFTESGVYTLFVSDYQGDETGSYQLSWYGFLGGSLIQVTSIVAPSGIVPLGSSITPKAVVTNIGWQEETFKAKFQIYTIYSDSIEGLSLLPGESDTISFSPWRPLEAAAYITTASTLVKGILGGDMKKGMVSVSSGVGPEIYDRDPAVGGNKGSVTINITGSGFEPGITARLIRSGQSDIVADSSNITFTSSKEIHATFDLKDAQVGTWNLKVTNPDNDSYFFYEGFEVIPFEGEVLTFCEWETLRVQQGTVLRLGLNVPDSDDLFILLKKTTHIGYSDIWSGSLKLLRQGEQIAYRSGSDDFDIHLRNPEPGWYTLEIQSNQPGDGLIKACANLDSLPLGEWKIGTIYRPYGCDWVQLDVPADQTSLFLQTEGFGLWSTLDIYHGYLGNQSEHWQALNWGAGYHIEYKIKNPPPGRYYIRYMDSAVMQGTGDQTRQYMIFADTKPIIKPPPSKPIITDLSTYRGGTSGPVTVVINGRGLDSMATVFLSRDGFDGIDATWVVGDSLKSSLKATFFLSEAEPGEWALTVRNPDMQSGTAPRSFTVQTGGQPELWVQIIGRDMMRIGRYQSYVIRFGNSGSVDAVDYIMLVRFPLWIKYYLSLSHPELPDYNYWSQIPMGVEHDSDTVIPLWIDRIPVNAQEQFTLSLMPILVFSGSPNDLSRIGVVEAILQYEEFKIRVEIKESTRSYYTQSGGNPEFRQESQTYKWINGELVSAIQSNGYPAPDPEVLNRELTRSTNNMFRDALIGYIGGLVVAVICGTPGIGTVPCALAIITGVTVAFISGFNGAVDYLTISAQGIAGGRIVSSLTPEDKYGPTGFDSAGTPIANLCRFIPANQQFHYRIDFWNKEDATAPAQEVFVVDTLNANFVDSTFAFAEFGFLRWTVPLEGGQYFNVNVDMRPDMSLIVNVVGKYDQISREVSWTFRSLDPQTMQPPEDPMAGFLPPMSDSGYEIGWVDFTVDPKPSLSSGTKITNQAFVKFDVGDWRPAPKERPYVNTIDALAPNSKIEALSEQQPVSFFELQWSGADDDSGSGVKNYLIYVSDDGAPYTLWLTTDSTSGIFTGRNGHTYRFVSLARDNVGNTELSPTEPDAVTKINLVEAIAVSPNPFVPTRGHTQITFFGAGLPLAKIKIYNKAGELVQTLEESEGKDRLDWNTKSSDGKDLASGVYIWVLIKPSGHKEKGKFAIIR
jgi:hypothetical protein